MSVVSRIPRAFALLVLAATASLVAGGIAFGSAQGSASSGSPATTTPIQHLVVIFDENVSFDHYFGTYPYAANPAGEPSFTAAPGTPDVNGLYDDLGVKGPTGPLLTDNGNTGTISGSTVQANPMLLGRSDALTCDQDHGYSPEQAAADHGGEDQYPQNTGNGSETLAACLAGADPAEPVPPGAATNFAVMDYYDGNTVTGLWNYAQHFAMSDNAYGTTYGPSTPGALNVTSAQTYGAICGPTSATIDDSACSGPPGYDAADPGSSDITTSSTGPTSVADQPAAGPGTDFSDADPTYDICSYMASANGGDGRSPGSTIEMGGNNVGEELTTAGVSWGWFEGGFDNGYVPGQGTQPTTAQVCSEQHQNVGGGTVTDYIPHHEPFQYYASTANPMHTPPSSVSMIGHDDAANHQYDLADFWAAADAGNMPQVSFLKASAYQDGHAGYSDPLDEQSFLVDTINHLEKLPTWSSTAVVITWDDSDGWYDHVLGPVVTASETTKDSLTAMGACGSSTIVPTNSSGQPEQGRCGVGPRLPFLVVSPYARQNWVSDTLIDQSSVVKFIEGNWSLPALGNGAADTPAGSLLPMFDFSSGHAPKLFLDPSTGEPHGGS
jgi:phospholipase C